jgi:hypothetical protein
MRLDPLRDLADPVGMATLRQKIAAERKVRELLDQYDVPAPDAIEYGFTCIRAIWEDPKLVLIVDIDPPPDDPGGADRTAMDFELEEWDEDAA